MKTQVAWAPEARAISVEPLNDPCTGAALLAKAGLHPEPDFSSESSRKLRFATNHPGLDVIRVRSFNVATFVAFGAAQIGGVTSFGVRGRYDDG